MQLDLEELQSASAARREAARRELSLAEREESTISLPLPLLQQQQQQQPSSGGIITTPSKVNQTVEARDISQDAKGSGLIKGGGGDVASATLQPVGSAVTFKPIKGGETDSSSDLGEGPRSEGKTEAQGSGFQPGSPTRARQTSPSRFARSAGAGGGGSKGVSPRRESARSPQRSPGRLGHAGGASGTPRGEICVWELNNDIQTRG